MYEAHVIAARHMLKTGVTCFPINTCFGENYLKGFNRSFLQLCAKKLSGKHPMGFCDALLTLFEGEMLVSPLQLLVLHF